MKRTSSPDRRLSRELAARLRASARTTGEAERQRIFPLLAERYERLTQEETTPKDHAEPATDAR